MFLLGDFFAFLARFAQADGDGLFVALKLAFVLVLVHCLFDFFTGAWVVLWH